MKNKDMLFIAGIILAAVIVSFFLSPLASKQPDGLEKVAENLGFAEKAGNFFNINFIMAEYTFPGIKSIYWQKAFSGLFGVLIIIALFAIIFGLIFLINKKRKDKRSPESVEQKDSFKYFKP